MTVLQDQTADVIVALKRPTCRIPLGEPDANDSIWRDTALLPPLRTGAATDAATEARALAGERHLFVRFDCRLENPAALAPSAPYVYTGRRELVFLDLFPDNDPTRCVHLEADYKGMKDVKRFLRITGEKSLGAVPDLWRKIDPRPLPEIDWKIYFGVTGRAWFVELEIPWALLGLQRRPAVIGFQVGRQFGGTEETRRWQAQWPAGGEVSALEIGQALLGPDPGAPDRLELDPPRFGRNHARLFTGELWPAGAERLRIRTVARDGSDLASREVTITAGAPLDFHYTLDRGQCSHLDVFNPPRLVLELLDAKDQALYTASLPMDRHLGYTVEEPFGQTPADGSAGLDSLRDTWLSRVVSALPALRRSDTNHGAPSDFCLLHADGALAVNLVADDAWHKLAALVESRFVTAEDRLVGAMALIGQKAVTNLILCPMFFDADGNHTYHSAMHSLLGPLSVIRYGGGTAVCRAAALARLLQFVHDPATCKPFVTRVVSLTRDGGPTQVTRCFARGKSIAPFMQQPGRVGAVMVDYRASQTLLDPTALAFFPVDDKRLATVERLVADATLRRDGAGALAGVYGLLDLDEARRAQPDRLLSKGVFPELCADEEGDDRPFDPRQCQTPRFFIPPERATCAGFLDATGRRGVRDGSVSVSVDVRRLTVTVQVRGIKVSDLRPRDVPMERVHVVVDVEHAHTTFAHFQASLEGARGAWRESATGIQTLFKRLTTENQAQEADLSSRPWDATIVPRDDGYDAVFALPWETIGGDPACTIGLNVWIDGRWPHYEQVFLCRPRFTLAADPFTFADVYLGDTPVAVESIDLGEPTWGRNVGVASLRNLTDQPVTVALCTRTRLCMRRACHEGAPTSVTVPAGAGARARFEFCADPEEKMGGGGQRVELAMRHGQRVVFESRYHLGYCGPVSVYFRFGPEVEPCDNPRPGEADYLARKVRYLCSRLPRFERFTTRQGAASDFVIRAHDGSVEFNLMEAGVLDRIGRYIADLFDTDLDRILGLYCFKMSPAVMRHLSGGHRFMEGAGALSVMRGSFAGGGGNCGYNSRAFAGLAAHLPLSDGPHDAHTVAVYGHVISALRFGDTRGLIDADVGHIFLNSAGDGLATLRHFRADPDILTTAGPGDRARYYTFDEAVVLGRPGLTDDAFAGVFPPGAPRA